MEPGRGISNRLGLAALLLVAGFVCGLHAYGLDHMDPEAVEKNVRRERLEVTKKLHQRRPLDEHEKHIMQWRPGDPYPAPPSWPWYAAGAVLIACASGLGIWTWRCPQRAPLGSVSGSSPPSAAS